MIIVYLIIYKNNLQLFFTPLSNPVHHKKRNKALNAPQKPLPLHPKATEMKQQQLSSPIAHLQQQRDALQVEYTQEKQQYTEQAEQVEIGRRLEQGICWYPLTAGRSYYNAVDRLVIELERHAHREIEHSFEPGRAVSLFVADALGRPSFFRFTSTVSYVQDDVMVVTLPSTVALSEVAGREDIGVQLFFDEASYRAMFAALSEVTEARVGRLAALRDILVGPETATLRDTFPIRFPWLNPSQEAAVNRVLGARDVAIVHGPPGTGKTTTLVEAVYETLHREPQVMVAAQSNTAVDWIAEKLVDRGIAVLRIGNPTRVNDKMLSFTYERRFESHPNYPELWSLRKAIRELQTVLRSRTAADRDKIRNRLAKLRERTTELEIAINEALFSEARVVACTLVGAANKVLAPHRFTTLFIDEAAQALEAACWIAISKADRVIFAGDHQQLPPTVKSVEAAAAGLGTTLMETIARQKPETVSLLTCQYRMNRTIMEFSSRWFYGGQLTAAPEVEHRGILDWDTPIVWADTAGCNFLEEQLTEGQSRLNRNEAELLILRLQGYMESITAERILDERIDFGIISPYKAQVHYLRRLIRRNPFFKPFRRLITVHTVDGFQGQERDVIVISLVRANSSGQIGFLGDLRRMNVAMTRARMKLIIMGDAATLAHHRFYRKLYEYVKATGKVIRLQEENSESNNEI